MAQPLTPPNSNAKPSSLSTHLFAQEETRNHAVQSVARPDACAGDVASDKKAFCSVGERMLRSARQQGLVLSLLVMQVPDLPELEIVFGREAADKAVDAVMKELSALAGRIGYTSRTGPDTFGLLLPLRTGEELELALRRRLGRACCVEVDFDEEEIVLVPDVHARTIAQGDSIDKTYSVVRRAIESKRYMEQLRCDYLRREREAHSTHMSVPPELARAPELPPNRAWRPTLPQTIAMPIGGN